MKEKSVRHQELVRITALPGGFNILSEGALPNLIHGNTKTQKCCDFIHTEKANSITSHSGENKNLN